MNWRKQRFQPQIADSQKTSINNKLTELLRRLSQALLIFGEIWGLEPPQLATQTAGLVLLGRCPVMPGATR